MIELEDNLVARLEAAVPARSRRRSEFIRNAIRRALWQLEEDATAEAYRRQPGSVADVYQEARTWEPRSWTRRAQERR